MTLKDGGTAAAASAKGTLGTPEEIARGQRLAGKIALQFPQEGPPPDAPWSPSYPFSRTSSLRWPAKHAVGWAALDPSPVLLPGDLFLHYNARFGHPVPARVTCWASKMPAIVLTKPAYRLALGTEQHPLSTQGSEPACGALAGEPSGLQKSQRLAEKPPLLGRLREVGRVGFACCWAGCTSPPSLVHLLQGTWGQLGSSCEPQEGQLVQLLLEPPWPASSRKLVAWHFSEPGVASLGVSARERSRLEAAEMFI